ncbi:MAG: copper-translocating P-type ATPase [Planctomycetota bacterium]
MQKTAPAPELRFQIKGLHCAGCVSTVETALTKTPGVAAASVNLATESALVTIAPEKAADADQITGDAVRSVHNAGYEAVPIIERPRPGPPSTPDISAGSVATAGESVAAHHAVGTPGGAEMASGDPQSVAESQRDTELRTQRNRLIAAALLGLPVMAAHMLPHAGPLATLVSALHSTLGLIVQALLTVAVLALAAGDMLYGAWRAVRRGSGNMDLLVSLGALVAFGAGGAAIVTGLHNLLLFEAAVMIVLFVGAGKYAERRARGRATSALAALAKRLPRTAIRVRGEQLETVPIDAIDVGDTLRVAAPVDVPVDGDVLSGSLVLDESMLTGESREVHREIGGSVFGGTRATGGQADIRATATGRDSAVSRLARLVADAQATRTPTQRIADRAAAWFTPVVLAISVATCVGWLIAGAPLSTALTRAIAVLVVACPCAMGLAVPMAVLVGSTYAARRGILIRQATALEAAGGIQTVFLDKTGTLTRGEPVVSEVQAVAPAAGADGRSAASDSTAPDDALAAAGAVARLSGHPIAHAIAAEADRRRLQAPPASDFVEKAGLGMSATVAGRRVLVGNGAWLRQNGAEPAGFGSGDAPDATIAWIAVDGRPQARILLRDEPSPDAADAIRDIRAAGARVVMLSGDAKAVCDRVAGQLGIDDYAAEMTPAEKLERIRRAAREQGHVAMVGDGINDAPALAAATVGIAIGAGRDVAREAADICLIGRSVAGVASLIRISRATVRTMWQNLAWAVGYNVIMMPAAIFTQLPPAWATAAMMLSSLSVVGNSLRLWSRLDRGTRV